MRSNLSFVGLRKLGPTSHSEIWSTFPNSCTISGSVQRVASPRRCRETRSIRPSLPWPWASLVFVPAIAAVQVPHAGQSMSLLILVPHAGHGWWVVRGSFLRLLLVRKGFRLLGHELALLNTAKSSRSPGSAGVLSCKLARAVSLRAQSSPVKTSIDPERPGSQSPMTEIPVRKSLSVAG